MTESMRIREGGMRISLGSERDVLDRQSSVRVGRSLELTEKSVNTCHRTVEQENLPNEPTGLFTGNSTKVGRRLLKNRPEIVPMRSWIFESVDEAWWEVVNSPERGEYSGVAGNPD